MREGKFTGLNEVNCVGLRMKRGWVSGSWRNLMMQCRRNKFGSY